ncbi:MAG: hypothetical protein ACNS63_11650 [Candidatus Nitrospinota bacterium M3_3B_026]
MRVLERASAAAAMALGVAFQGASLLALLMPWPFDVEAPVFAGLHGLASASLAWFFLAITPKRYSERRGAGFLLFFSLAFFMPFLGALGVAAGVMTAFHFPKKQKTRYWRSVGAPELPYSPIRVSPTPEYGEGGVAAILRNTRDSAKKIKAVMAADRMRDERMAVSILRQALKDSDDDVRLLAYSSLSRREKIIDKRIRDRLHEIEQPGHDTAQARMAAAMDYWELAYLGLAQGDTLSHALGEALRHLDAAARMAPADPAIHFQAGRILLAMDREEEAKSRFKKALDLGFPPSGAAAYLAEIAFRERRFDQVKKYMRQLDTVKRRQAPLSSVAEYWT